MSVSGVSDSSGAGRVQLEAPKRPEENTDRRVENKEPKPEASVPEPKPQPKPQEQPQGKVDQLA